MIHGNLFKSTNQNSTVSLENSKILNITSKYFKIFNKKPSASWVAYIYQKIFLYVISVRIIVSSLNQFLQEMIKDVH